MTLLALDGVAGVRSGRVLFDGIALSLAPGEAALVTGPNGAGKSTLLRIAAGLLNASAGAVTRAARIAWLGDAAALDDERTLAAALEFWARLDGGHERVPHALAAYGLLDLADVPVRFLSTGQRRRGALARVAASGADLWLLDEPANGLDAASVAALQAAVTAHRTAGGAALIATHQPLDLPGAARIDLG